MPCNTNFSMYLPSEREYVYIISSSICCDYLQSCALAVHCTRSGLILGWNSLAYGALQAGYRCAGKPKRRKDSESGAVRREQMLHSTETCKSCEWPIYRKWVHTFPTGAAQSSVSESIRCVPPMQNHPPNIVIRTVKSNGVHLFIPVGPSLIDVETSQLAMVIHG
jgi:hypothetical protein